MILVVIMVKGDASRCIETPASRAPMSLKQQSNVIRHIALYLILPKASYWHDCRVRQLHTILMLGPEIVSHTNIKHEGKEASGSLHGTSFLSTPVPNL
jgi:hypothetical protein